MRASAILGAVLMAAVSLSTIRARFATAIDALSGFSESRNPFENFGRAPNTVAHLRFAVGIINVQGREDDRQRETTGIMSNTMMGIRFAYRVRPKDQIVSYDESFDKAQEVIKTITNKSAPVYADLSIRFDNLESELTESGEYMIFDSRFEVIHFIPLT